MAPADELPVVAFSFFHGPRGDPESELNTRVEVETMNTKTPTERPLEIVSSSSSGPRGDLESQLNTERARVEGMDQQLKHREATINQLHQNLNHKAHDFNFIASQNQTLMQELQHRDSVVQNLVQENANLKNQSEVERKRMEHTIDHLIHSVGNANTAESQSKLQMMAMATMLTGAGQLNNTVSLQQAVINTTADQNKNIGHLSKTILDLQREARETTSRHTAKEKCLLRDLRTARSQEEVSKWEIERLKLELRQTQEQVNFLRRGSARLRNQLNKTMRGTKIDAKDDKMLQDAVPEQAAEGIAGLKEKESEIHQQKAKQEGLAQTLSEKNAEISELVKQLEELQTDVGQKDRSISQLCKELGKLERDNTWLKGRTLNNTEFISETRSRRAGLYCNFLDEVLHLLDSRATDSFADTNPAIITIHGVMAGIKEYMNKQAEQAQTDAALMHHQLQIFALIIPSSSVDEAQYQSQVSRFRNAVWGLRNDATREFSRQHGVDKWNPFRNLPTTVIRVAFLWHLNFGDWESRRL